jgi:hypothetical protein
VNGNVGDRRVGDCRFRRRQLTRLTCW